MRLSKPYSKRGPYLRKELAIIRLLRKLEFYSKPMLSLTKFAKELQKISGKSEYDRTLLIPLHRLMQLGIVEKVKRGKNAFYILTPKGRVVADLVFRMMRQIKPLHLYLEDAIRDPTFYKLKRWMKDSREVLKSNLGRSHCLEPLKYKLVGDSRISLQMNAFSEKGIEMKNVGDYTTSHGSLRSLLDNEIDFHFIARSTLEGLSTSNPKALSNLVAVCVFGKFQISCLENPRKKELTVYYPAHTEHRARLAKSVAGSAANTHGVEGDPFELIKGAIEGDYHRFTAIQPEQVYLPARYGFNVCGVDIEPAIAVLSKSIVEESNYNARKLLYVQHKAFEFSKKDTFQYDHILNYILKNADKFKKIDRYYQID